MDAMFSIRQDCLWTFIGAFATRLPPRFGAWMRICHALSKYPPYGQPRATKTVHSNAGIGSIRYCGQTPWAGIARDSRASRANAGSGACGTHRQAEVESAQPRVWVRSSFATGRNSAIDSTACTQYCQLRCVQPMYPARWSSRCVQGCHATIYDEGIGHAHN